MSKEKSPYILVKNEGHLNRMANELKKEREIGVDLEADSMFHYQEKVCLIVVSELSKTPSAIIKIQLVVFEFSRFSNLSKSGGLGA